MPVQSIPNRIAHSHETRGMGVAGHVKYANGESSAAAHTQVAAATAPAGNPVSWRRMRFAPNPYIRAAVVPASAAGQTLTPAVLPLDRTGTPTKAASARGAS